MLQQTQVATVIPYFETFLERFPDVGALSRAPAEAVMAAWAGLGYYSRARLLHRCAQRIVYDLAGRFPQTAQQLAKLPGIGRSTAAAIAVFAFGERAAILDGNVKRVLARCFGIEGDPGTAAVERRLWQVADSLVPETDIASYTQGLMDLGATVCVRSRPRCDACPLAPQCIARQSGRTAQLPTPRARRQRPVRCRALLIVRDSEGGAVLLEQRPSAGIWGGLLSLPEFDEDADELELQAQASARYGLRIEIDSRLPQMKHEFTHYTLLIRPTLARLISATGVKENGLRRISAAELPAAPLPAPVRRLLLAIAATSAPHAASDTCERSSAASARR